MKRTEKRGFWGSFFLALFAAILVFLLAKYVLLDFFPSQSGERGVSTTTQSTKWSKTSFGDGSGTMVEVPMDDMMSGAALTGTLEENMDDASSGTILDTGSTVNAPGPARSPMEEDTAACTLEYAPVCGADGRTYSNACMANRAKTIVAHDGACAATTYEGDTSVSVTDAISSDGAVTFDTGSYLPYENSTYSFMLPKYAYYAGYGAQSGAAHTLAIGLTSSGTDDFATADVRVYYYSAEPASPPSGQRISVAKGVIYVDGDSSNAKVAKIIDAIGASAK